MSNPFNNLSGMEETEEEKRNRLARESVGLRPAQSNPFDSLAASTGGPNPFDTLVSPPASDATRQIRSEPRSSLLPKPALDPLIESDILDTGLGRGAVRGIVEAVPQTGYNLFQMGKALITNPGDTFKAMGQQLREEGKNIAAHPIRGTIGAIWEGMLKPMLVDPALLLDDWTSDIAENLTGRRPLTLSDNMTEQERYAMAQRSAATWATLGIAKLIGAKIGPNSKINTVLDQMDIPKGTPAMEILTKYVPAYVSNLGPGEAVSLLSQTSSGLGDLVKKGLGEGVGAGGLMGLMERAESGEDVAANVFSYGVAGGILGVPFELGFAGVSKARKGYVRPDMLEGISNSIKNQIADNLVNIASPDVAPIMAHQLASGLDVVTVMQKGMRRDATIELDGIPTLTPEQLADPNLGKWVNPETGLYRVVIQGEGVLDQAVKERLPYLEESILPEEGRGVTLLDGKSPNEKLRVLHGTNSEFDPIAIEPSESGMYGEGIYTSPDPRVTNHYNTLTEPEVGVGKTIPYNLATTPDNVLLVDAESSTLHFEDLTPVRAQKLIKGIEAIKAREMETINRQVAETPEGWGSLDPTKSVRDLVENYDFMLGELNEWLGNNSYKGKIKFIEIDGDIGAVLKASGFDAAIIKNAEGRPTRGIKAPNQMKQVPYVLIANPSIMIPELTNRGALKTYTPEEIAFFNKNGVLAGEEASFNGNDVVIVDATPKSGMIKVIDKTNGEVLHLDRKDLTFYNTPEIWKVEKFDVPRRVNEDGGSVIETDYGLIPENKGKVGTFKRSLETEWQQIYSELDDAGRQFVDESNEIYKSQFKNRQLGEFSTLLQYGQYADRLPDGSWVIKDITNGKEIAKLNSYRELQSYNRSLSSAPSLPDLVKEIQKPLMIPSGVLTQESAPPIKLYDRWSIRNIVDKANIRLNPIVHKIELLRSMARRTSLPKEGVTGIDLTQEFHDVNAAILQKRAKAAPLLDRLNKVMAPVVAKGADMVNLWERALTTMSASEIRRFGIRQSKSPMTAFEIGMADKLNKLLPEYESRQAALRYTRDRARIRDNEDYAPEQQERLIAKLEEKVKPSEAQKQWADLYDSIGQQGDWLTITEYINALETNAPDRLKFIKDNNLPPDVIHSIYMYESLMNDLGVAAELPTNYMINGYLPRIAKSSGSGSIDVILRDKTLTDDTKAFANMLERIGYRTADELIKDPINVSARYISGLLHHEAVKPAVNQLVAGLKNYARMAEEDPKLAAMWSESLPAMAKLVREINDLANNVPNEYDLARRSAYSAWLDHLSGSKDKSESFVRKWNQVMEVKFQGFKPMAGARDQYSGLAAFGMFFGLNAPSRYKNLFTTAHESLKYSDRLSKAGGTPTLTPTQVENVDIPMMSGAIDRITQEGFKWSLQPTVYKHMYGMTYLETTKWVSDAMTQLKAGKMTRKQFNRKISLERYDSSDQQTFNELLDTGDNSGAVDFLAKRTGESVVGLYGTLNAPTFYRNDFGKIAGQFGQWSLWMSQNVARNLSTGRATDRLATLAYLAGSGYGVSKIKDEFGIDLSSWLFNPNNLLPGGSPAYAALTAGASIASEPSQLVDWAKWKADNWQSFWDGRSNDEGNPSRGMAQLGNLLTPIPIEMQKAIEAANRFKAGQPPHIIGWTLLGGSGVDKQEYPKP